MRKQKSKPNYLSLLSVHLRLEATWIPACTRKKALVLGCWCALTFECWC